tara:strand:- start:232 stop:633 length:402 start_codon:yes stop_codon:yes gene_type:complete
MSIKLALLKSGEEVIADIAEFRNSEDELVSYLFKKPYCVKIKTSQVLVENESRPKHQLAYYKWMSLSKDDDIIVNRDWVVCISEPLDSVKKTYEEKVNGRRSNDTDGSSDGRDGGARESYPSINLNESNDSDI